MTAWICQRLLLVIDDPEVRQLYHELLVGEGWEVLVASDATEGMLQLIASEIRIVVMTALLKNKEWEKFLKIMGHKPLWQTIPIILLDYEERKDVTRQLLWPDVIIPVDTHVLSPAKFLDLVKRTHESRWVKP